MKPRIDMQQFVDDDEIDTDRLTAHLAEDDMLALDVGREACMRLIQAKIDGSPFPDAKQTERLIAAFGALDMIYTEKRP